MTVSYSKQHPDESLNDYIFSFWKTENDRLTACQYTVFPDAGIELIVYVYPDKPVRKILFGLSTQPVDVTVPGQAVLFGIRFKLLAADSILQRNLTINSSREITAGFWDIDVNASTSLEDFACAASAQIVKRVNAVAVDTRKRKLLGMLHATKKTLSVRQLSLEAGWGERQINRYFTKTFGLPLKQYLGQIAFFSSMKQLGKGHFIPQHNYYDQSHFIRQVKRYTGITPKQIYQLRNGRFLQIGDPPTNSGAESPEEH